jgi:hypothetical protein
MLIGGFHTQLASTQKSMMYLAIVKQYLESQNFTVNTRIGMAADDDFLYMTHAAFFVPSGGGFSMVIKQVAKMQGCQIITPVKT